MAGSAEGSGGQTLLPVRMITEFAYCPRLFHLMFVDGEWEDNAFTEEGRHVHRRVDELEHVLPEAAPLAAEELRTTREAGDEPPVVTRSVTLGSEVLGVTARLDLVSTADHEAAPIERKRGHVPDNDARSHEPERVQLMAQGLLLRAHGYSCDHGILYFDASRRRVTVPFTEELEARTLQFIELARQQAESRVIPSPLRDSPKCAGCSLAGICLPDETIALTESPRDSAAPEVRRLYPVRSDATPLYVQEQGARIGTERGVLTVKKDGQLLANARLADTDHLVIMGNVSISEQAVHVLCEAAIPIVHCSTGHWFYGVTHGIEMRSAFSKAAQFRAAQDDHARCALARAVVIAKIANQRTLLRRNGRPPSEEALIELRGSLRDAERARSVDELLGIEGNAARCYFSRFGTTLRPPSGGVEFEFGDRNRRPPRDPVNAMLSFGYAILAKECTVALLGVGLEPHWGFYHAPRHGRPALALDLMEEFRPLIVDSAVITAINTGMVKPSDFTRGKSGCLLKPSGRKAFLQALEARLDQLVTHPTFGYRLSWRSTIRLQGRLLARTMRGDVPAYTGVVTR